MNTIENILCQIRDNGKVEPGVYEIDEWFEVNDVGTNREIDMRGVFFELNGRRLYNCVSFVGLEDVTIFGLTIHANGHKKVHTCDRRGAFYGGDLNRKDVKGNTGVFNLTDCRNVTVRNCVVEGAVTDSFFDKGGDGNEFFCCYALNGFSPNGTHKLFPLDFKYRPRGDGKDCTFNRCVSFRGNGGFGAQDRDTNGEDRFFDSTLSVTDCLCIDPYWGVLYNEGVEDFLAEGFVMFSTDGHIPRHGCKLTGGRVTELRNCRMDGTFIHGGAFRSTPENPITLFIIGGEYRLVINEEQTQTLGRWNATSFKRSLAMFDGITQVNSGTTIKTTVPNPFMRTGKNNVMVREVDESVKVNGSSATGFVSGVRL